MPRILYVATVVKTHIMEFHIPYLKMLKDEGWETAVAAKNDYEDPSDCNIPYCDHYYDIPIERNPFRLSNIRAYSQLRKIINAGGYDIIHCHTPMGAALTRLAAGKARKNGTRVFYTAHGFHFYKGAPLINWLVYYPVERLLAHRTDVLITINKEDYERAKKFKAGRVEYVPGVGVDTEKFNPHAADRNRKRAELGLNDDDFVILTVGELTANKNHEIVLEALKTIKDGFDQDCKPEESSSLGDIKYLICGSGSMRSRLEEQTENLGIRDQVVFLGYRDDINEICCASDMFVFMSKREGLPIAVMEAMASGLPVICSRIRGNIDLVRSEENGLLAEKEPQELARAIDIIMNSCDFRNKLRKKALEDARQFDVCVILPKMMDLYKD